MTKQALLKAQESKSKIYLACYCDSKDDAFIVPEPMYVENIDIDQEIAYLRPAKGTHIMNTLNLCQTIAVTFGEIYESSIDAYANCH